MAPRWFAPLHHVFHDLGATTPNLSSPSTEYVNPIRTTPHSPPIPHPISVRRGRACRPCHDLRACSALSLPNSNPARALGGWVLRLTVNQQTDLVQVRGSQASSPRRRRQQVPVARTHTSRQARVEQLCCALVTRREPCEGLRAAEAGRRKGGATRGRHRAATTTPSVSSRQAIRVQSTLMETQVVETCFVAPREETPTKGLWLSSLDVVLANRGHTPLVYFYRSNNAAADFFNVGKLKAAMSKALAAFYPLAGQLGLDSDGRVEINCNGKGVLFVVARSELTVDDFSDIKPSPELRRLFVPRIDSAEPPCVVLAVQVTFMKCGGVALGVAVHHVAVDAPSLFHFVQTWSAFTRDGADAVVELPCHDRMLLRSRSPPVVHPDTLSVFCPKLNLSESLGPVVTKIFSISKYQVSDLKRRCGTSTFCAVSAHVWQCACIARRLAPDVQTHLSFPMNIRRRVRPPLPYRYFGCGLIMVGVAAVVRHIISETLASVAGRIKGTIDRVDDELVRSAIDYSERSGRDGRPAKGSMPENELRVISWLGMPAYDADFGWQKPQVMSRAESVRGGFVYLMSGGPADDSSVRVVMCMEAARMDDFERLLHARLERPPPYARF